MPENNESGPNSFSHTHLHNADFTDYPHTRRDDKVTVPAGNRVLTDPYRWLEEDIHHSDEVRRWTEEQNCCTRKILDSLPGREDIRARLTELIDYDRYSAPSRVADYYVFFKQAGLQEHRVLYVQQNLDSEPEILLNPNEWSDDGSLALSGLSFSNSGDYMAWATTESGSDWRIWKVMNVRTRQQLPDVIQWSKMSSLAWTHDDKGFFYARFPEPETGLEMQAINLNHAVYYHWLRSPQHRDVKVWDDPSSPEHNFMPRITEDGRWLIIYVWKGTDPRNKVLIRNLSEPFAMPMRIIDNFDSLWMPVTNEGSIFWFWTDNDAPRGRIVRMDILKKEDITEIVGEQAAPIRDAGSVANMLVVSYLQDVQPLVRIYQLDGTHVRDVTFPGIGTGYGFSGMRSENETFYTFSSFNQPPIIYRYDMITGRSSIFRKPELSFNPEDFQVKQVFYTSRDGTRVPMFLAKSAGASDNNLPALLYGYGGFNHCSTPGFSPFRVVWMELGGVFAVANIRGGGEYGLKWHQAAKGRQRKKAFEDFISAAEWLSENISCPGNVFTNGASNGGLLVAASLLMRPDIFGAVISDVGVHDMLRFHLFTAGRYWTDEYGDPDNAEDAEYLASYSPYHNVKKDTPYPPVLLLTADTDDRVVPSHTFKMAARLQNEGNGGPFLLRVEKSAGHGLGKPVSKIIEEWTDKLLFLKNVASSGAWPAMPEKPHDLQTPPELR